MLSALTTIHRAIWRLGILIWLSALLKFLLLPGTNLFSTLYFYLLLEAVHVYSEFKRPHPEILGVWASSPVLFWRFYDFCNRYVVVFRPR